MHVLVNNVNGAKRKGFVFDGVKNFGKKGDYGCFICSVNPRNEQFLLFPRCFLLIQIILSPFVHIFDIIPLFAAEFEEHKIGISGKGLNIAHERRDMTKIMLKVAFNAIQAINLSMIRIYDIIANTD